MVTDEPEMHMAEAHGRGRPTSCATMRESLEPVHIQVIGAARTEHHDGNHDGP